MKKYPPIIAGILLGLLFIMSAVVVLFNLVKAPPPPEIWPTPKREEVENQLMQERISTLARGYLARLRRGADVQTR